MNRRDLLALLSSVQSECAPITLTIGEVSADTHQVRHDSVTITDAPPKVLSTIFAEVEHGRLDSWRVGVHGGGVRIACEA
jgi:hypothetical protein